MSKSRYAARTLRKLVSNLSSKSSRRVLKSRKAAAEMSFIIGNIREVISIKLKSRHDSFTDQFSRIFMVKIFIVSSLIMSVDFFSDKVTCILPRTSHLSAAFVHSSCWIQGFYIYEEMVNRVKDSGYYGIPKDLEVEGIDRFKNELCRKINKATGERNLDCREMTKRFYLQYQYFPFYIASLAVFYYLPYILYRMVNTDMISLRGTIKDSNDHSSAEQIAKNYFNHRTNGGVKKLRARCVLVTGIKLIYVCVNVAGFLMTDFILNGDYRDFGYRWVQWARLNNSVAYDYMGRRDSPRPGNTLLPAMGFCEVTEGSRDVQSVFLNSNKFICEISPNILYQYVLTILWFLFVASIVIAVIGVFLYVGEYVSSLAFAHFGEPNPERKIWAGLTYREIQYLHFIRGRNLPLYGEVLHILKLSLHEESMKNSMQASKNGCHRNTGHMNGHTKGSTDL